MGLNMVKRLLRGGVEVVAHNRSRVPIDEAVAAGAMPAYTLDDAVAALSAPRVLWLMLPAGDVTEQAIDALLDKLSPGDILVDGGNSYYGDSMRRAEKVKAHGLHYVDVGTSGGVWGLDNGYSLMIGGDAAPVDVLRPAFEALAPAPDRGWGHVGPVGAGHFTKMVHNGIEYGMMQAFGEGFELLQRKTEFGLDLHQVAEIWRDGSVVRSWLLDLAARALEENPTLEGIAPVVQDSGEGRWTVLEAIALSCPLPVITLSLENRFRSRDEVLFAEKMLAALRNQFGGHAITREE
jgi:6-phosphogluconate dehydrogenase